MERRPFRRWLLPMGMAGCLISCAPAQKGEPVDLILKNGVIITMDDSLPRATAVAVARGRIVAVGGDAEIGSLASPRTRVCDLRGMTAIPGFIESHAHFSSLGASKLQLDLTTAGSWADIVAMVRRAAAARKPGEWIAGRGWHQEKWNRPPDRNVDGLPRHDELSAAAPRNPVLLIHASGHSCLANRLAMEEAGIGPKSVDPAGGTIVRDEKGHPIGAFLETAMDPLVSARERWQARRTPAQIQEEKRHILELADRECSEKGITTFHDAGASFADIELMKSMIRENRLHTRLYVMISEPNDRLKEIGQHRLIDFGDGHLTVRSIKRLIDGALGAHGAWLLQPYDSLPGSTGLNTESLAAMREAARIAIENGFQLCTHAIGDRGNRETLDIYEEAFRAHPDRTGLRWRIEHAQHLNPRDIPRFAGLGVIAAMQGIHCTSDGPWVPKRIGNRRAEEGAYAWRKLLDSGAVICNGTDAPVEAVDPIPCYYSSVTRKMKDGTVFFGQQRMTRMQALRSYTLAGAYAAFEEKAKGSISVGKRADITILSRDLTAVPDEEIPGVRVMATYVGGVRVYREKGFPGD